MKVLIVLDSLNRAGAERQALCAVGELTRQGRHVELIYYNKAKQEYDVAMAAPAVVKRVAKNGKRLRFLWKLTRFLKQGRYDVVHAFMSGTSIYVGLAAWMAGVPVVFAGMRAEYDGRGIVRLAHRLVNRLATGWIVNSQATVRSMLPGVGAAADRVFVVYNGIDPTAFLSKLTVPEARAKFGIDAASPVVSVIARLETQKNIPLFLQAAQRIVAQRPQARFLIAGDGSLRKELEADTDMKRLSGVVQFVGNRPDIPDLLMATDVLALTSTYEGLSNTILEAMSVGLSVVSTAYAGIEELVVDGQEGFVVPLNDCETLVRKLLQLLDDPDLRARMGACGRRTVQQRFTIPAMSDRLYSVYLQAFEKSAPHASREADRACA